MMLLILKSKDRYMEKTEHEDLETEKQGRLGKLWQNRKKRSWIKHIFGKKNKHIVS